MDLPDRERDFARDLVLRCLRSELRGGAALPEDSADWAESGLDSMACVAIESCIARAINAPSVFGSLGRTAGITTQAAIEAVEQVLRRRAQQTAHEKQQASHSRGSAAAIAGWGAAFGSETVPSATVEREFRLTAGTLSQRAGMEAVSRAAPREDEISLAHAAAQQALGRAEVSVQELSCIIATSETFLGFPSLAASVHTRLLAPGACRVFDVGGGCAGVVNCLAVADTLLAAGRADSVLLVSADVHSRLLLPERVPGEFGGLFGDGASAFVARRGGDATALFSVLATASGCTGAYASALQIRLLQDTSTSLSLAFDGESLALAAMHQMEQILRDLETSSGRSRSDACAFALHQPNPRLLEALLKQANLAPAKVPVVGKTHGNLGSSTCGAALSMALEEHSRKPRPGRGPLFVAAVAPGLLWAGAVLE